MPYFLIAILLAFGEMTFGQMKQVTNVFYRIIANDVEIFYDLPKNADTLSVKAYFYKKSDPKMKYRLSEVSGDIGIGVFSGKRKKIVWHYKAEPPYLFTGSGFYYKVVARKITKKERVKI